MSLATLHSIATVTAFTAFLAIVWWAYSPRNRKRFEEDAKLALDDDLNDEKVADVTDLSDASRRDKDNK
ncbi:cbb3-type cytochrome oxidase subunit 3 [Faucicola atlantae]|uniref:Cytochrome C n=1 Tax=Faucicola atlantae TaxID=34059 RepID=A0A1B8QKD6_9GAMM|nr:cbb3-type cytochrome c oxidase subunit 3 [Moraxella atlantae]OBX83969.1 cytochrome C [Moraxella atlantae]